METRPQDSNEAIGLAEIVRWMEADKASVKTAIQPKLENRVEGQSWAVDGVYDSTFPGQREATVTVHPWGWHILIRSLSGEQRHRILNAAINRGGPSDDAIYDIVLNGVFDPLTGEPAWKSKAQLEEVDVFTVFSLARVILRLSGVQLDCRWDAALERRAAASDGHLNFLLRAVHFHASDDEVRAVRLDMLKHFLLKHEEDWRGAVTSTYGYIGKSVKNEWIKYAKGGNFDGDHARKEVPVKPGALRRAR